MVPVLDGARTIARQLDALSQQSSPWPWEVVVADNGSTDATASVVRAHPLGARVPLRRVDAGRRRGVNVARNAGVRAARGALVLFCDADDRVAPGWLEAYGRGLLLGGEAVAAGPLEVEALNTPRRARWGPGLDQPVELGPGVLAGWGANMALHRSVWERLGGFDESLREGFDEIEFFVRAARAGLPFVWLDDARVDYRLPASMWQYATKAVKAGRGDQRARRLGSDPDWPVLGVAACARHLGGAVRDLVRPPRASSRKVRPVLYAVGLLLEALASVGRRGAVRAPARRSGGRAEPDR